MEVWADTDMGADDLFALLLLAQEARIAGVSLCFGVSSLAQARRNASGVGFETILPEPGGGALAWRPGAVRLGDGPYRGRIRGASFAGERREYVIDSELGVVKADTPASAPQRSPGEEVAFDLPRSAAVRLQRSD